VSEGPDIGEEDVDMFGLRAEGHVLLGDTWYARGVADLSRLDGDAGLVQANASIGTIRSLTKWGTWNIDGYLQAGIEYVRASDLDRISTNLEIDGSGDEVGATAEIGVSLGFRPDSRVEFFAKYLALGDGGVSFGIRASHDLNELWTLTGGVDAVWVEDGIAPFDLDLQRLSLGVLRKF